MMKKILLPLLMLLLLLQFSCRNPCKDVECLNGGVCLEGTCDCPEGWTGDRCAIDECLLVDCQNGAGCVLGSCVCGQGYYGEFCQFTFQDRFIGQWRAEQVCTPTVGGPGNYTQYTFLVTAGGNDLEINLYFGAGGWVTADIEDFYSFTIPRQDRTFGRFEGLGNLLTDSTMTITYIWHHSGRVDECELDLVRL